MEGRDARFDRCKHIGEEHFEHGDHIMAWSYSTMIVSILQQATLNELWGRDVLSATHGIYMEVNYAWDSLATKTIRERLEPANSSSST